MAAFVTPFLKEYSITACLKRMSCVILFIADRVAPAFRFCLDNSTLTHAIPIRYSLFLFVTHHCNTYSYTLGKEKRGLTKPGLCDTILKLSGAPYRGVEQLEARRAHNPEVVGSSPASATIKSPEIVRFQDFFFVFGIKKFELNFRKSLKKRPDPFSDP